jgi:hypothetical protein
MLKNDLKARLNWGSGQQHVIYEFDMSDGGERKLLNDAELSLAFSERMGDKKLFLFVDVEDKPTEVFCSFVTEAATSNVGHDNVTGPINSSKEAFVSHAIDWDSLESIPLGQDQIGAALPVMDEDAMYEFVGLMAEDERLSKLGWWLKLILMMWTYKMQSCWLMIVYLVKILCYMTDKTL